MRVIPDRLFARALLLRALGLWLGVRMAKVVLEATIAGSPLSTPPSPFVPPLVAVGVMAIVGWLMIIDLRRRGERVLLANFGVPTWAPFALGVAVAALLELAMAGAGAALHADAP
jgi:hypothetical protein